MPDYRAYIIGPDGEFHESVPLDCADDNVAMMQCNWLTAIMLSFGSALEG
jgi:hypothetical protein